MNEKQKIAKPEVRSYRVEFSGFASVIVAAESRKAARMKAVEIVKFENPDMKPSVCLIGTIEEIEVRKTQIDTLAVRRIAAAAKFEAVMAARTAG